MPDAKLITSTTLLIETLIDIPALPVLGVKAVMLGASTPPVLHVIESIFPTASCWHIATFPYPSITCDSRPRSS